MTAVLAPCRRILFYSSYDATNVSGGKDRGNSSSSLDISSISNPFVKHCVKLRLSSSYRHAHSSALIVGLTPIMEISRFQEKNRSDGDRNGDNWIECLLLLDGVEVPRGYFSDGEDRVRVLRVSRDVIRKVSGLKSVESTEAIAVMRIPRSFCNLDLEASDSLNWFGCSPFRVLVLEGIQDPGNLGTLLRSARAFKWDGVFLLPGCCDPFNEKVLRAARGSSFQFPIVCGSWDHLEVLRDRFKMKMLAAHPSSDIYSNNVQLSVNLADMLSSNPVCLALGSEGQGLSERTKITCELVSIPMAGEFESLNVAVAGGILLYMLQPWKTPRIYYSKFPTTWLMPHSEEKSYRMILQEVVDKRKMKHKILMI